jgi:hypothetical protein
MSHYTAICMRCPDKRFIVPGTEAGEPRHEGNSHRNGSNQAEDAARRDADHMALPVDLRDDRAQFKMFRRALEILRDHEGLGAGRYVSLRRSDQGSYGFELWAVCATDGKDLLPKRSDYRHPLAGLADDLVDELGDLEWDGVVGENEWGYATIDLLTGKVVS